MRALLLLAAVAVAFPGTVVFPAAILACWCRRWWRWISREREHPYRVSREWMDRWTD